VKHDGARPNPLGHADRSLAEHQLPSSDDIN
jgi:hypothetical protein